MKDILELVLEFVGEYFAYFFNTLINEDSWFDPIEFERKGKRVSTIDPKLILFSIINLLIGSVLLNTIVRRDLSDLTQFIVVSIALWIIWSTLVFLLGFLFKLKISSYFQSLSISLQVFGVAYVLASLTTVIYSAISEKTFIEKLLIYFIAQLIYLSIFLTLALFKNYNYKLKIQPIIVGLLASFSCVYINFKAYSRLDLPFPALPPETTNIALVDLSSIPKNETAYNILKNSDSLENSLIYFFSDSINSIIVKDKTRNIDSALKKIKYNKTTRPIIIDTSLDKIKSLKTVHLYAGLNTEMQFVNRPVYCDTLSVHFIYRDTNLIRMNATIDLFSVENDLRFKLRNVFYYRCFVFAPCKK